MADTTPATTQTTRPVKARKAVPATPKAATTPKATTQKTTTQKAAPRNEPVAVTRFKVELDLMGETKSYTKFTAPSEYTGVVVGSLYVPIGTQRVVVLVIGDNDTDSE